MTDSCNLENQFPCGPNNAVDAEVASLQKELKDITNSIISDIEAISLPDTQSVIDSIERMLKDYPTTGSTSIEATAELFGLPSGSTINERSRIYQLGLAVLGDVGWGAGGTNFENLGKLYLSFGKDFEQVKRALSGFYGKLFVVYSLPKLTRIVSPSNSHYTYEEIIGILNRKIPKDLIYNTIENQQRISYVLTEEFIGVNQTLQSAAASRTVSTSEVTTRLFSLDGYEPTTFDIKRLKTYGFSNDQISTSQGVEIDSTTEASNLITRVSNILNKTSISNTELSNARKLTLEALALLNFEFIDLESNLVTRLKVKNTEAHIIDALNEGIVSGILDLTEDELTALVLKVSRVEAGSFEITNAMLTREPNYSVQSKIQTMVLLAKINGLKAGDDATDVASYAADTSVSIVNPQAPAQSNITYKSYDSGGSLIGKILSMDKTFQINFNFNKKLVEPIQPISTNAINRVLQTAYNSAFRATAALGSKVNNAIRDIETATSLGLAISGEGSFDASFLKCAAGVQFNFDYNPLRDLINLAVDTFNAFLDEIIGILRRIIKEILCKITCLRDSLGLGGLSLDLPFCDITIPELLEIPDLTKFLEILENLYLNNIGGSNRLKFALLDLSDSFSNLSDNDCNCQPLGGLFNALKVAVPVGFALGQATGFNSKNGVGKLL